MFVTLIYFVVCAGHVRHANTIRNGILCAQSAMVEGLGGSVHSQRHLQPEPAISTT